MENGTSNFRGYRLVVRSKGFQPLNTGSNPVILSKFQYYLWCMLDKHTADGGWGVELKSLKVVELRIPGRILSADSRKWANNMPVLFYCKLDSIHWINFLNFSTRLAFRVYYLRALFILLVLRIIIKRDGLAWQIVGLWCINLTPCMSKRSCGKGHSFTKGFSQSQQVRVNSTRILWLFNF